MGATVITSSAAANVTFGATAETGIIGTHDLHATVLHLLGINHERLTYRYAGRNFRLTDVEGEVAKDILA